MFDEEREFSEDEFRSIRSTGDSQAGQWLSAYIRQEVAGAVMKAMDTDATDAPSIAYAQACKRFGTRIWGLLNWDIDTILAEHNIQPEEEDEPEDKGREGGEQPAEGQNQGL